MEDRIWGCPVQEMEYHDLKMMTNVTGLFEHNTHGNHHTWSNKHTNEIVYSKMDRVICNMEWYLKYPNSEIQIMPLHISDHAPLKVVIDPNIPSKKRTQARFKFLNFLVDEADFTDVVRDNWNTKIIGRPMQRLWRKLKRLRTILRGVSRRLSRGA